MTIIELIKKFINWLIELIKSLFGKKKKKKRKQNIKNKNVINNKKIVSNINEVFNSSLPVYMIINDNEKEKLIYNMNLLKNVMLEKNEKIKEIKEKELITLIEDKCGVKVNDVINQKYIEEVVKDINQEDKKEIIEKYHDIAKRDIDFQKNISEIDKVIDLINTNNVSIITADEIEKEISNIVNDKNIDELNEKINTFNKKTLNIIENFDKDFIDEVVKEYKTVNYVTIVTTIIDKNYEKFKKLEEDFKNHRFNKYYYEREVNKIKRELQQIKNLKNKKDVREHIEKLKKELYTKSKDKYDLLYNNEVFFDINKKCDILLDKVNTKVIDIKKTKEKEEKEERIIDENELEYEEIKRENILLRFQDLNLATQLIEIHQQIQLGKMNNSHISIYLDDVYKQFLDGVDEPFNYESNKVKTELVSLINDLNNVISRKEKKDYELIEHPNFLMRDLVNAAVVKKQEVEEMTNKKIANSEIVDEKLEDIREKYIEKKGEKTYSKGGRKAA